MARNWIETWSGTVWENAKRDEYVALKEYLQNIGKFPPRNLLDIGCGLAPLPEMFQKEFGTKLDLIDDDGNSLEQNRDGGFGPSHTFKFYNNLSKLKESFDARGMKCNLHKATELEIPEDKKFDLIISIKSCGFHYPLDTYRELVMKHTTPKSVVIMDVNNHHDMNGIEELGFVYEGSSKRMHFRFKPLEDANSEDNK